MDKVDVQILNRQTRDFIFSLEDQTIGKVFRSFELLETFGHTLGMPHVKQIDRGLYELRVHGKQEIRLFFTFQKRCAVILHGFTKKTMQTPIKELKTAQARLNTLEKI